MVPHILVTGGAGYIGSHTVRVLLQEGFAVTVLDDLSTGHLDAIPEGARSAIGDLRDSAFVARTFAERPVSGVLHFAGAIQVGESTREPLPYWDRNVHASRVLLSAMRDADVQHIVFSSTAAVYGTPERTPIPESAEKRPESPYGETKWAVEQMLAAASRAHGLRYAALRYFNAAGADPGLGERHHPETHLIPLAIDAALGRIGPLTVFGTDWPTPDGTCIRDYVHVHDLARAHVLALSHLQRSGENLAANLGAGVGTSVMEVLREVERATGRSVPHAVGPRRAGDPERLVADIARARAVLSFVPEHGLARIVDDAVASRVRARA